MICGLPNCQTTALQKCSRCKRVYYCSKEHQTKHWKQHKHDCKVHEQNGKSNVNTQALFQIGTRVVVKTESDASTTGIIAAIHSNNTYDIAYENGEQGCDIRECNISAGASETKPEVRECRCMFCGSMIVATAQEDTVAHLEVCPALQEQLDDPRQFTLPKSMR